jgi:hypothetical protein
MGEEIRGRSFGRRQQGALIQQNMEVALPYKCFCTNPHFR